MRLRNTEIKLKKKKFRHSSRRETQFKFTNLKTEENFFNIWASTTPFELQSIHFLIDFGPGNKQVKLFIFNRMFSITAESD